jgi:hypothetical protein
MSAETWSQIINWRLVLPPSRPDTWQLVVVADHLTAKERNRPVAVLGSTIEFRDLLAEMGFTDVYVLEHNRQFHKLVSADRIYSNSETVIWGNWLETLHQTPIKFSAILSDLTSGNVNYTNRSLFYSGIAKALDSDGIFMDRMLTHSIPHEPLRQLAETYQSLPINLLTINRFSCEFIFCSELLTEGDIVDSDKFYAILRARFDSPRLQRFVDYCHNITPAGCIWWYGKPWKSLAPDFERHLQIIDIVDEPLQSAYAGRAKLLLAHRWST